MARRKVTTAPVLASWAETDKALRDIRECRHTLAELAVERDRKIDAAKDTYTTTALPVQNRVKELEGQVKAFVDGHRAELVGKSRALNFGVEQQTGAAQGACGGCDRAAESPGAGQPDQAHRNP